MPAAPPTFNLIVIRSADMDRAAAFYQALGLRFTKHRHGTGPRHYASEVNGFVFEIYPLGSANPTTSTRIGFSVDDIDSTIEALSGAGGEVLSSPQDSQWGRRAVVKDPDGHKIELVTPTDRDDAIAPKTSSGENTLGDGATRP